MDDSEKHRGVQSAYIDVGQASDPYDSAKSNAADRRDMARMGKPQEMRVSASEVARTFVLSRRLTSLSAQLQELDDV